MSPSSSLCAPLWSEQSKHLFVKEALVDKVRPAVTGGDHARLPAANGARLETVCVTFSHPSIVREQPAPDSDAWDPLSYIDHPGSVCVYVCVCVCAHTGTYTNIRVLHSQRRCGVTAGSFHPTGPGLQSLVRRLSSVEGLEGECCNEAPRNGGEGHVLLQLPHPHPHPPPFGLMPLQLFILLHA